MPRAARHSGRVRELTIRSIAGTQIVGAAGGGVRVQELLAETGLNVPYSTLTRWIREAQLREPPQRSGEYHQAPGEEMQHDTSPHRLVLSGKPVIAQCSSLALAYSRRLFFQYYPRFTRFEAKHFLLEAVRFHDGSCPLCIILRASSRACRSQGPDREARLLNRAELPGRALI